jgi:long-chain acyl-CoA synthetase
MKKYPLYDVRTITDLRDMFDQSAALYADKPVFLVKPPKGGDYQPVTYATFQGDVRALGTAFMQLGLRGGRIAVIGENRYEWTTTYLAAVNGVAVIVPLDKELPPHEIENLLRRSRADAVVFSGGKKADLLSIRAALPQLKYLIGMDEAEDVDGVLSYAKILAKGRAAFDAGDRAYLDLPIDADAMSILLFTSGTTSDSKAVMLSHRNICINLMAMCQMVFIGDDVFLSVLPMHHTYECTCGFLCQVYRGNTVAFCEGLRHVGKNLKESHATRVLVVPQLLEALLKRIWQGAAADPKKLKKLKLGIRISNFLRRFGIDLRRKLFAQVHETFGGRLHMFISGGAPIDPKVMKGLRDLGFQCIQGYGLTECAPILALNRDVWFKDTSAGLALPGVEMRIDAPDEKGVGEICGRGPNVFLGYYENEEATKEALVDGWFHTGDLGYIDRDGFVIITGRKKNVIVTKNGKKIFPEEVETLLGRSPYILESLVYGLEGEDGETTVAAEIFPDYEKFKEENGGQHPDEATVRSVLAEEIRKVNHLLVKYKYIKRFDVRTEEFVKTTTKKIKRYLVKKAK